MDFGLAQQVAKKDRRNYHIPMSAYHCNKCGCWHVGGYPTRRPPGPLPILNTNHQVFLGENHEQSSCQN